MRLTWRNPLTTVYDGPRQIVQDCVSKLRKTEILQWIEKLTEVPNTQAAAAWVDDVLEALLK